MLPARENQSSLLFSMFLLDDGNTMMNDVYLVVPATANYVDVEIPSIFFQGFDSALIRKIRIFTLSA